MTETTNETVTTNQIDPGKPIVVAPVKFAATKFQSWEYFIYFLFGVLEILLTFRLIFKIAGASTASAFIRFIYGVTGIFVMPFEGIFRRAYTTGVETTSVFEPSALVALVVYAVLAYGIVMLVRVFSGEQQAS